MSLAVPSITNFSPVAGPAGTAVTIQGSGFSGTPSDNLVTLAGALMVVASATPTVLVAIAPSLSNTTSAHILVHVGGKIATSTAQFTVFGGGG
jgi:IPT/TIG domain